MSIASVIGIRNQADQQGEKMDNQEIKNRLTQIANENCTVPGWTYTGQGGSTMKAPTSSELLDAVENGEFDTAAVVDFDAELYADTYDREVAGASDEEDWIQIAAEQPNGCTLVTWIWMD
jgi:hypothetical protein